MQSRRGWLATALASVVGLVFGGKVTGSPLPGDCTCLPDVLTITIAQPPAAKLRAIYRWIDGRFRRCRMAELRRLDRFVIFEGEEQIGGVWEAILDPRPAKVAKCDDDYLGTTPVASFPGEVYVQSKEVTAKRPALTMLAEE